MTINGDHRRQTENGGGSDPQTRITAEQQPDAVGALAICQHCDGTGWTPHGTKGLIRCTGLGFPHGH